jgi:hypothetical protein
MKNFDDFSIDNVEFLLAKTFFYALVVLSIMALDIFIYVVICEVMR